MNAIARIAWCGLVGLLAACGGGETAGGEGGGGGAVHCEPLSPAPEPGGGWDGSGFWGATGGPDVHGVPRAVAATADGLIFVAADGLLRSSDAGASWDRVRGGALAVDRLVDDGEGLFLRLRSGEVLASFDRGRSWSGAFEAEAIFLHGGDVLLVRREGEGFVLSRRTGDGALQRVGDLPVSRLVTAPFSLGEVIVAGDADATEPGLVRSTDGGASWTRVPDSGPIGGARDFASVDRMLFALSSSGGVQRSLDEGRSWSPDPVPGSHGPVSFRGFVVAAGRLVAGKGEGLFSWDPEDPGWLAMNDYPPFEAMAGNAEALFGLHGGLLYRWEPRSNGFQPVHDRFPLGRVESLTGGGGVLLAATGGAAAFRSDDRGATWSPATALAALRHPSFVGGARWLAAGHGGLVASDDGARTWAAVEGLRGDVRWLGTMQGVQLALVGSQLHRSQDGGRTFVPVSLPEGVDALTTLGEVVVARRGVERLFVSHDAGCSWSEHPAAGIRGEPVRIGSSLFALREGVEGRLSRSDDDGASWVDVGEGAGPCIDFSRLQVAGDRLIVFPIPVCESVDPDHLEVAREVWASGDGGATFERVGEALPAPPLDVWSGVEGIFVATDGAGVFVLRHEGS